MRSVTAAVLAFGAVVSGEVYFKETFETEPFESGRWQISTWKQDNGEAGKWEWDGGKWTSDESRKGIRTTQDAKFYSVTAALDKEFDNADKQLVFQFSVKHEQKIDCGGGYAKLLPAGVDVSAFNGETDYSVMFGPDICGYSTKKVHAILNNNGENLETTSTVKCPDDEYTHVYTMVLNSDETYDILVDGDSQDSGSLKDAWAFEEPLMIPDPDEEKPEDWVDEAMIEDAEDVKPEDWDNAAERIPDPDASQPEDWDQEEDGEWEAPMIRNPEYKGPWRAKRIDNPEFKGVWKAQEIANPAYVKQDDVYKRGNLGYVGIEIWQVKAGTLFSDFILTDSLEEAKAFAEERKVNKHAEVEAKKEWEDANAPPEEDEEDFEDEEEMDKTEL